MPQHSLGASALAWAMTSSSSAREIRMSPTLADGARLLGRALERAVLVVLIVAARVAAQGVLELPHAAADRAADLGQALRAEHDEGDDEHDDELTRADV